MPFEPGQLIYNRYRIVRMLGKGGYGAVYRAWDVNLEHPCALKENLVITPEAQRQFNREASLLANLSHPNLPRVTDHFTIAGQGQYLVMDFIEGEDLQSMLRRIQGPLPESRVLAWISQICEALIYLHSQNPPVIHRDIKPSNIKITLTSGSAAPPGLDLLTLPLEETCPYLVDFGIAKVYQPHMDTTIGARAVSPGFSPPEQYGQGGTDARSDVYALGATFYALLTGQKPAESIQRNLGTPTTPPHKINPSISPAAESLINRTMEILPEQRFQSMVELKSSLQQALQPIQVVQPAASGLAWSAAVPSTEIIGSRISVTEPFPGTVVTHPEIPLAKPPRRYPWAWIGIGAGALLVGLVLCSVLIGVLMGNDGDRGSTQTAISLENQITDSQFTENPTPFLQDTSMDFGTLKAQTPIPRIINTSPAVETGSSNLEPAIVEPYCTMYEQSPVYVGLNQPVILKWRWSASTEEQVRQHIEAGIYEIFLDGKRIKADGMSEIQYLQDKNYFEVYWYANLGVLSPGNHRAERYLYWLRQITDGWDTYGPGGKIESEYHYCEIIVQ